MNQTSVITSSTDESKARFKGLRPSRLNDPLIARPAKTSPIPIYY
jgi:hypothetical protein